jgi:HD-GYP domain-containing protein (c-di-GMP phosphodiesterase class II)
VLVVSPAEATEGMTLVAPVFNPALPDQELLRRGFVLEPTILKRLNELGVDLLYVDFPGLDDVDKHLAPFLSTERRRVCTQIKDTIKDCQQSARPTIPYDDYATAMRELVTTLMSQGQHPVFMDQMSRMGSDAVGHATAVAHLSLLLGLRLERYLIDQRRSLPVCRAKEVVNAGVAGMLHDIGKTRIPADLQNYNCAHPPLEIDDRAEWEEHARIGFEMLHNCIEPTAATAVLHHHQRYDGSGFPAMKFNDGTTATPSGDKIHVFARILMVADLYDRVATSTPKRMPNIKALYEMRTKYGNWCDPTVLAALHVVAPPFPPGSKVHLNDGTAAIVTQADPTEPFKPTVRRLKGTLWEFEGEPFSLRKSDCAIQSIDGIETAKYLPAPK